MHYDTYSLNYHGDNLNGILLHSSGCLVYFMTFTNMFVYLNVCLLLLFSKALDVWLSVCLILIFGAMLEYALAHSLLLQVHV